MRLATTGNLRVAAAAKRSYGEAMQLGYRTGTITGMLTDGLGLLGGTCIFLVYGEQAYEALLGFGFGGTLLALFMRVGGGIYTKAADVGADLVGKVEAGIPEDDPRNAATIADNVGDNVGDCAGMAADIFESYEVTIVAAMILGLASFGHKGVIFPLLVRGIGVLGSIISTYTVKAGAERHLRHGPEERPPRLLDRLADLDRRLLRSSASPTCTSTPTTSPRTTNGEAGFPDGDRRPHLAGLVQLRHRRPRHAAGADLPDRRVPGRRPEQGDQLLHAHLAQPGEDRWPGPARRATPRTSSRASPWATRARWRPCWSSPRRSSSRSCVYWGTPPVFVAYGVAMTGIGMLTLTGNTISMDVFGPVADNANGIGEMGYNRDATARN